MTSAAQEASSLINTNVTEHADLSVNWLCCLACSLKVINLPGKLAIKLINGLESVLEIFNMDEEYLRGVLEDSDDMVVPVQLAAQRLFGKFGGCAQLVHKKYLQPKVVQFGEPLIDSRLPGGELLPNSIIEILEPKRYINGTFDLIKSLVSSYKPLTGCNRKQIFSGIRSSFSDKAVIIQDPAADNYDDILDEYVYRFHLEPSTHHNIIERESLCIRKLAAMIQIIENCTLVVFDKVMALVDTYSVGGSQEPNVQQWIQLMREIFKDRVKEVSFVFVVDANDFGTRNRNAVIERLNAGLFDYVPTIITTRGMDRSRWEITSS